MGWLSWYHGHWDDKKEGLRQEQVNFLPSGTGNLNRNDVLSCQHKAKKKHIHSNPEQEPFSQQTHQDGEVSGVQ